MKKKIITITIFIILIISIYNIYVINDSFIVKNFEHNFNIHSGYILKEKFFKDQESYLRIILTKEDMVKIISQYRFISSAEAVLETKGRIHCKYIDVKKLNCIYIIKGDRNKYNYLLGSLDTNSRQFIIWEYLGGN
jgi:hypothetical protein